MINIFSFAGLMVSFATIRLCCYGRTVCVVGLLTKTGSGLALTLRIYQADTGCNDGHPVVICVPLYLAYLFLWLFVRFTYLSLIAVVFFTFLGFVELLDLWVHSHDSSVCFLDSHCTYIGLLYIAPPSTDSLLFPFLSFILDHSYCSVFKFSNHFFFSV